MSASERLDDLDGLIRRVDSDRWLSSRYVADTRARAALIALYAYDHEITRAPRVVSNPLMGEIRLAWWREALDEIEAGGGVRQHPVVQGLTDPLRCGAFSRDLLEAALDARYDDLEPAPFVDEDALNAWLDAAHGSIISVALRALDASADNSAGRSAARAWGLTRLPADRLPPGLDRAAAMVEHLRAARAETARLTPAAFPAVVHATLARRPRQGALSRRLALTRAVLTGRV